MTRTLLIDADIIAYQSAASNEKKYDWGDTGTSHIVDMDAAKASARDTIDTLVEKLKADVAIICLSDDMTNFRTSVDPTYKTNRDGKERPTLLYDMKDWLREEYPVESRPTLEADDVMGILSTEPHTGERIIVSQDKDMQTIPGLLFNPNKDTKVRTITPEQAERFMLWQAITGDQTDGYPGCPGAGPKAADEVLDGVMWSLVPRILKSGPRKGQTLLEWKPTEGHPSATVWDRTVALYEKYGLGEPDALVQVNLARILKHCDFDGKQPIPWTPEMLLKKGN